MSRLYAGLLAIPLLLSTPTYAQDIAPLETVEQRFSYLVGLQLADRLKQQGLGAELDVDAFAQAMRDVFSGTSSRLTPEEAKATIEAMQAAAAEKDASKGNEAVAAGQEFLAENGKKEGTQTTASGLQYVVTVAADGPSPAASDRVKVHYEGRLLSGKVFDSSIQRGEPAVFGVTQVIPGWQEALQLMKVGETWEVWLPSDLAYGPTGAGGDIGPNETLNFTIQLLGIE
ncbi:MAG: FKBP-type peptidyl-prolyl cis-trans isomerase [Alphaproteobacteria bacterium]|jgi:FKBP-type peptidyl-prolyl cis-trans isomerase